MNERLQDKSNEQKLEKITGNVTKNKMFDHSWLPVQKKTGNSFDHYQGFHLRLT